MSPAELRNWNIKHFEKVLAGTAEPAKRALIERLISDERAKPDSSYPPGDAL
jgi:hypothetical protein